MKRVVVLGAVCGALLSLSAAAQVPALPGTMPAVPPPQQPVTLNPPPGVAPIVPPAGPAQRYRGTITELNGPFLSIKTADKQIVVLGVTMNTRVIHNRLLKITDLQPGWYVGVSVLKAADGKLRAQGVRVYPAGMRGQNEGAYGGDPKNPMRLMIVGAVTTVTPGGIGGVFTVAYRGAASPPAGECSGHAQDGGCQGAAAIQFARGVPIIAIESGDVSLLASGATVSASASPDANGTLVASAVTVEKDAPPPKP